MKLYLIPALLAATAMALPAHAQSTVSIDIYAIPSAPIVEEVAAVSKELSSRGMTTFHAQGHAVHATLYLTQYPVSAEPRLKAAIARLAQGQVPLALTVDGAERTAANWLFLHVDRTAELQRLADQVTLAAEPWRDHNVVAPGWMKDYPAKLPAFQRYGSPNVFMQFEPHLTLLANETNPALGAFVAAAASHPPRATGTVEGLGIAEVDANGQIVKTLAEYRFTRR